MPRVLLVYQCGGSDLQFGRNEMPRGISVAERVELANEVLSEGSLTLDKSGEQRVLSIHDEAGTAFELPILGETLAHIVERLPVPLSDWELFLMPLVTQQATGISPVDTAPLIDHLGRLRQPLSELLGITVSVAKHPKYITQAAAIDQVAQFYEAELWPHYEALVRELTPRTVYIQATGGTPAMTIAAKVFSRDSDAIFLYTPVRERTREIDLYHHELRRQTESLVNVLLDSAQYGAAGLALSQKWNGFTPLSGDHPEVERLLALTALEKWWRREYHMATSIRASDYLPIPIRQSWEVLKQRKPNPKDRIGELIKDALLRLLVLCRLQDQLRFIVELNALIDLQQNFATMRMRIHFDGTPRGARFRDLPKDSDWKKLHVRTQYVARIYHDEDRISEISPLLLLCRVFAGRIRYVRNDLSHGGLRLTVDELSQPLTEIGLRGCTDLSGSLWTLFGLALLSAKSLGLDPAISDFAKALDALSFECSESVVDTWSDAVARDSTADSGWEKIDLETILP